jgi:Na+-driven multidrug efflux pump
LIEAGATVVRIMALSFGLSGAQMGLAGAFRGAGDTFVPMLLAILGTWVLQIPMAWLLAHYTILGSTGLWLSYPLSGAVITAVTIARFKGGRWKNIRLTADQHLQKRVTEEILIEEGRS